MLLKQLAYFITVVDCNSFTEAAEKCFISQSAISQQIRALEKELGVELIHRENRRFRLTNAGEYFYRHGQEVLNDIESLTKETAAIGGEKEQELKIGYLQCYAGQELHQGISEFSRKYPKVSIHIASGTHEELYHRIISDEVDIALSDQRRVFAEDYVNYHLLYGKTYAEVSTLNPLSTQEYVDVEQLQKHSCILIASKQQRDIERTFYHDMLGIGERFLYAESIEEGRLMVAGNRGLLPVEEVGVLASPIHGTVRIPMYRNGQNILRNYCAFWPCKRSTCYVEAFADILKNIYTREGFR